MAAAVDEFDELMRDKDRRGTHPEDYDDDERQYTSDDGDDRHARTAKDYDGEDDDDDDETTFSRPSVSLARHTIPRTRLQANTGPKGVIADAQDFRDSRRVHVRHSLQLAREELLRHAGVFNEESSLSSLPLPPAADDELDEDDHDDDDDDDDEFLRSWRDRRLEQLAQRGAAMQERPRERQAWAGRLNTVDGEGYLNAVEKNLPGTVVAVYIYDDESDVSVELEDCVRQLARQHPETRFVRLHYLDAEMEPAGVPALLAYRDGEKFAGLVPLIMEIPDDADVSAGTLEVLLRRHQILR